MPLGRSSLHRAARLAALAAVLAASPALASTPEHRSGEFAGEKANRGAVLHSVEDGQHVLTLSADFEVPDAPDPHWRVIDSRGKAHLLDRLTVKPGQTPRSRIVVPASVPDVAKVQIWCSWAEAVLGEASFAAPVAARGGEAAVQARRGERPPARASAPAPMRAIEPEPSEAAIYPPSYWAGP
jgi:hypothetical protein